jgi:hypothetical protein
MFTSVGDMTKNVMDPEANCSLLHLSQLCTRDAQKVTPLIFSYIMKITHYAEWWSDIIPYSSTRSTHNSMALCQWGKSVYMPYPAHVVKLSLQKSHCHQTQTLYSRLHPLGLQTNGYLRVIDWGWKLGGTTLSNQILRWHPKSSNLHVA